MAAAGISASRGGVTEGGKETGVAGRQSKDPEEAVRRGGGRRGVGYFELEQRLWDRDGKESEERGGTEGAKLSSAGGPRITLKVRLELYFDCLRIPINLNRAIFHCVGIGGVHMGGPSHI